MDSGFNAEVIKTYLKEVGYLNSGLEVVFINEMTKPTKTKTVYKFEDGLNGYIKELTNEQPKILKSPICLRGSLGGDERYEVVFTYIKSFTSKDNILLFVNSNRIPNGGTAVTGFKQGLTKSINEVGRILKIVKEREKNLKFSDTSEGLVAIISVTLINVELEGQTKNTLNNKDLVGRLSDVTSEYLNVFLEDNPKITGDLISKMLQGRRAREAAMRARNAVLDKEISKGTSGPSKLTSCVSKKPAECEMYIVEGDSASGGFDMSRDPLTQAYLPLRGKVLNILKIKGSIMEALNNNEIKDIVHAIGAGVGEDVDISKCKYHKIILLSDADPDGYHITSLLLVMFYYLLRPIIEAGYLYVGIPPLYVVRVGSSKIYCTDKPEMERTVGKLTAKGTKFVVQRLKGLGEMNPDALGETCLDKKGRRIKQVTINDLNEITRVTNGLFGVSTLPRKKFLTNGGVEL